MSKTDSPNIFYIDFQKKYSCDNDFGTDFAVSRMSLFYNSCWFKMKWFQNTFTDDTSMLKEYIMPNHPVHMLKEYKVK